MSNLVYFIITLYYFNGTYHIYHSILGNRETIHSLFEMAITIEETGRIPVTASSIVVHPCVPGLISAWHGENIQEQYDITLLLFSANAEDKGKNTGVATYEG